MLMRLPVQGYDGMVKAVNDDICTVELQSVFRSITVPRDKLAPVDQLRLALSLSLFSLGQAHSERAPHYSVLVWRATLYRERSSSGPRRSGDDYGSGFGSMSTPSHEGSIGGGSAWAPRTPMHDGSGKASRIEGSASPSTVFCSLSLCVSCPATPSREEGSSTPWDPRAPNTPMRSVAPACSRACREVHADSTNSRVNCVAIPTPARRGTRASRTRHDSCGLAGPPVRSVISWFAHSAPLPLLATRQRPLRLAIRGAGSCVVAARFTCMCCWLRRLKPPVQSAYYGTPTFSTSTAQTPGFRPSTAATPMPGGSYPAPSPMMSHPDSYHDSPAPTPIASTPTMSMTASTPLMPRMSDTPAMRPAPAQTPAMPSMMSHLSHTPTMSMTAQTPAIGMSAHTPSMSAPTPALPGMHSHTPAIGSHHMGAPTPAMPSSSAYGPAMTPATGGGYVASTPTMHMSSGPSSTPAFGGSYSAMTPGVGLGSGPSHTPATGAYQAYSPAYDPPNSPSSYGTFRAGSLSLSLPPLCCFFPSVCLC